VFQFERLGYYAIREQAEGAACHRVVGLKDTWSKLNAHG
jgi:hypothetical protein